MDIWVLQRKLLLFVIVFLLVSCKRSDNDRIQNSLLINELKGSWEAIEVYSTDGASQPTWAPINSNLRFYYTFTVDAKVTTNHYVDGCNQGSIQVSRDSILTFILPCIAFENKIDLLLNDTLILDTQNFEPLKYKFTRPLIY